MSQPFVFALEEVVEEAQLELAAVVGVEVRPVLDSVRLEPLLLRRGAGEALEVAARMQALAAPVGGGEERDDDLVPVRRAVAVVLVVERVREDLVAEVAAVGGELLVGERLVAADELPGVAALRRPRSPRPYWTVFTCMSYQLAQNVREDPAVVRHVAVPVGGALPDAHRRQVRGLQPGDVPLVHAVVGDAVQPDLAVATTAARPPTRCSRRSPVVSRGEKWSM